MRRAAYLASFSANIELIRTSLSSPLVLAALGGAILVTMFIMRRNRLHKQFRFKTRRHLP